MEYTLKEYITFLKKFPFSKVTDPEDIGGGYSILHGLSRVRGTIKTLSCNPPSATQGRGDLCPGNTQY